MLKGKQAVALQALLTYPNRTQAAAAAGVDRKTLRGYFDNPEFMAEYNRAMRELVDDAARYSRMTLQTAIGTLERVASDPEVPPAARVAAANGLLTHGERVIELHNIIAELDNTDV